MPTLRHIIPIGYADVPLLRRTGDAPRFVCASCADVPDLDHEHTEVWDENGAGSPGVGCLVPGEVFECTDAQAKHLLAQTGNYELVTAPATAKTKG